MDPLSDLLRVVRLDGAFFYGVEATEPWKVHSLGARQLKPRILPRSEHLISYHILIEGQCYGGLHDRELTRLEAGDVIVFPHGDPHQMMSGPDLPIGAAIQSDAPGRFPDTVVLDGGGRSRASFVCGYLGCDLRPFNPLLAALPHQMHMRSLSSPWLAGFTKQVTEESRLGRAGADCVLTRLAELMFVELLRRYLDELPAGQTGWLAGVKDEMVGRVLSALHGRPAHPWTLAELAREAASSRSNLAKRFTEIVGRPPMQYLTEWRMQLAANQLAETTAKVAAVAAQVGYDSEAAFSRAFKKATGLAPGAWREARQSA